MTIVGIAFADDESERKQIISQIGSKLDSAASELSGMERKSDGGDIDDALSLVNEVDRLVEELKRYRSSSDAEKIVSSYPAYIRDFKGAAGELKKLKIRQPKAAEYLRQCENFDREMIAKANATKDDPTGADELSAFAKSVGRKGEDLLGDANREWSEVERSRDDARRFSASDGSWSNVRSNLHGSAEGIARDWRDNWDKAKRACEEVVKRERHRDVEKALGTLARSQEGRKALRSKIDELLSTVSDRVKDVQSQSDTSSVNGAIEITKELESQLERLRNAAGDDQDARRIASTWPSWVRELRTSLEALKEMKFNQKRTDSGDEKCEASERALQEKIRRYVADPTQHEQAIRELPEEADRIGRPIKEGIESASGVDRQMDAWLGKAKSFSQSDGAWGRVSSNLRDSSDRVFKYWRENFERMKKSCERLVLGREQPDVKRAVEEMMRDTKTAGDTYRNLRDEFNRWKDEVEKLREFSDQDVDDIRRELCAATDSDELGSVNEVADRWASQIRGVYGTLTGTADRIKRSADDLLAKKRAPKAAPKVKDSVDAILDSIRKVKDHQLQGSNNPLLRAYIQYGVDTHNSKQASCDAKEILIRSSYCENPNPKRKDCRLDCVKGCTIVEIKPAGASTLGRRQVDAYVDGLKKMYAQLGDKMFEGDFARFKKCLAPDGKALVISGDVDTYEFCPPKTKLAPTLDRVDRTMPSEPE